MGDDLLHSSSSSTSTSINSSNIGFQLLKKHGWKEGTGLGLCEQGRLEPLQVHLKKNKRGLGAEVKSSTSKSPANLVSTVVDENGRQSSKKAKVLSKKMRKAQALEKQLREKEFERAFFREFWPENV